MPFFFYEGKYRDIWCPTYLHLVPLRESIDPVLLSGMGLQSSKKSDLLTRMTLYHTWNIISSVLVLLLIMVFTVERWGLYSGSDVQ